MPHAEHTKSKKDSSKKGEPNGRMANQQEPMTNGDQPGSQFISHLTSYPVVSDSIETYKQNPYGAKSISVLNRAYSTCYGTFAAPVLPYLRGPVSIVRPYLAKADSIGDSGLSSLESRFPIVKADTATVKSKVTDVAGKPLKLAGQGKDYVVKTYEDELRRARKDTSGKGDTAAEEKAVTLYQQARAVWATKWHITWAVLETVMQFMRSSGEQAKDRVDGVVKEHTQHANNAA